MKGDVPPPLWRITIDRLVVESPDADPGRLLRIRALVEDRLGRLVEAGQTAPRLPDLPATASDEETADALARAVLAAVGGARGR